MMNENNKPVELLAPAGNLSCALAAFDAGADAVYAGLKRFNARERTENFSAEEMSKLLDYAHRRGRRVYVTFNTLIKESELDDAAQELAMLDGLRPDALIVQDIGIVRMAREYFPNLTLHGSTQMGLHNSAGLAFARELGLSRVILERQTTLAELEQIMRSDPPVEVEMFIHGALCCCISGSCLLSSWLGGWSGNRGKCKQPCRRRHRGSDGNGFFLSAQDLSTLEIIPQLLKTGISSFKIEGRLRRADYVSNVVTAYRMVMDAERDGHFKEVLPAAKERLARTCGRKWSLGYYTRESMKNLVKYDAMGVSGQLSGKVLSLAENGFTISASRPLYLGDAIRVQPMSGDEGPALMITRMSVNGKLTNRISKGETGFIHSDKEVPRGGLVYKTGEKVEEDAKRIESLPPQPQTVDMRVELSRNLCRISCGNVRWEKQLELPEAGTRPLEAETLQREFRALRSERFTISSVSASISGNPFLPASVFKSLRKEALAVLEEQLDLTSAAQASAQALERFRNDYAAFRRPLFQEHFCDTALLPRGKHPAFARKTVLAREIGEKPAPSEELVLPFYLSENALKPVREAIRNYVERGGKTIRITSLHHFALLKDFPGITIKTCMPLPVCNSMAAAELKQRGVFLAQAWLELGKTELEDLLKKAPLPMEIYRYGRPVLLSTRAEIAAKGKMLDAHGDAFLVIQDGPLTQILAEKTMSIPDVRGAQACFYDLRHADLNAKDTARFNFDVSLS